MKGYFARRWSGAVTAILDVYYLNVHTGKTIQQSNLGCFTYPLTLLYLAWLEEWDRVRRMWESCTYACVTVIRCATGFLVGGQGGWL
jgi:hypothetical protein